MWILLQLADSAFPTGGFAHSAGLEAAAQAGEVVSAEDVRRFARDAVWQAGFGALPLVRGVYAEPESLPRLDARADAFLANHVANRASRTQGRAFLATAARVFAERIAPVQRRAEGLKLHLAPIWGAVVAALDVDLPDAQRVLLWCAARNVLSAAVRLGLAGTYEAQSILAGLAPLLDEVHARCGGLGPDALAQPAPLLDLLQGTHDRLYSRLFQS
ncbi:MAG TPA: urease accessory UreF family protein [Myxococcales bacterium]|nr:urease accessory UreF family protein [Myxococcales bacterium]